MQWLKQSTAAKPLVGPFVAATDGVTAVSFLSSDADAFGIFKEGSTVRFVLDSNALVATTDATAFAHLTLGTTDVDVLGMLDFVAQDDSFCLPVMARFMVVEAGAYGAQVTGTDAAFLTASDVQAELVTFAAAKSSDVAAALVTYDAIKGTEGAWASDVSSLASDIDDLPSAEDIADTVWDEVTTDHVTAGTFGLNLDAQVSTIPSTTLTTSDVQAELVTYGASTHAASDVVANVASSDIWDALSSDFAVATSFGAYLDAAVSGISASIAATDITDIADGVWDEVTTDHVAAGTFGLWLDTQISTLNNIASSDVQAELVTYDAATGTEIGNVPTTNLDSSDIAASLSTYGGALGSDVALSSDLLALNNLASSDIAAELVTYDAATGTEFATLNNLADSDVLGYTLETGYTVAQALKLVGSALAGKVSGGGTTTIVFRDLADGANRITATVDSDGNRSAMTLNP